MIQHPGLRLTAGVAVAAAAPEARLLFLCIGSSARSQIAEALAVARSRGRVEAASAGSRPKPVHANAVRAMRERGVDVGSCRSKHLSLFAVQQFDYVITLCDKAREACPEFPGHPGCIHWSTPDPAASGDGDLLRVAAARSHRGSGPSRGHPSRRRPDRRELAAPR